jgi:hypothetical protein
METPTTTEARPLRAYLLAQIGPNRYNALPAELGLSRHAFEHWLTRATAMNATIVAGICRATGIPAADLFTLCHVGRNRLTVAEAEALNTQYPQP